MEMPVGVGLKKPRSKVCCSAIQQKQQQQQRSSLRRRSAAARLLGLQFRNVLRAWVFVSCDCCVGGGLCDEIIIRSDVCVCVRGRVCERACACARVRVSVCVCVCVCVSNCVI